MQGPPDRSAFHSEALSSAIRLPGQSVAEDALLRGRVTTQIIGASSCLGVSGQVSPQTKDFLLVGG
jgi:hypothetical protein